MGWGVIANFSGLFSVKQRVPSRCPGPAADPMSADRAEDFGPWTRTYVSRPDRSPSPSQLGEGRGEGAFPSQRVPSDPSLSPVRYGWVEAERRRAGAVIANFSGLFSMKQRVPSQCPGPGEGARGEGLAFVIARVGSPILWVTFLLKKGDPTPGEST